MEHESHHGHHPHGTGTRWLDITLAVAATIVSLVSLWLGLHSAHSMERLVAANSYPYLQQSSSASAPTSAPGIDHPRGRVEYEFQNNGVGPARIEWVELTFRDKPVTDLTALLDACCAGAKIDKGGVDRRGNVEGAVLRPGASMAMFTWDEPAAPDPAFTALHSQMHAINVTTCYCSVFDECYVRRPASRKPETVKECKAPATAFHPGFRGEY